MIKSSVSISQQSEGIYSLSKQLTSTGRGTICQQVCYSCMKRHICLKKRRTFCILTSCWRTCTDGLKLSHTALFTHASVRLSQFSGQWYLFIFYESLPSGSHSFINVLKCLPVVSQYLDQFPLFTDLVAAKHLAFTLMRGRIGHATVRQTRPNL